MVREGPAEPAPPSVAERMQAGQARPHGMMIAAAVIAAAIIIVVYALMR